MQYEKKLIFIFWLSRRLLDTSCLLLLQLLWLPYANKWCEQRNAENWKHTVAVHSVL